jgi:hypothetical protein
LIQPDQADPGISDVGHGLKFNAMMLPLWFNIGRKFQRLLFVSLELQQEYQ